MNDLFLAFVLILVVLGGAAIDSGEIILALAISVISAMFLIMAFLSKESKNA
jgi:hypothetical protein